MTGFWQTTKSASSSRHGLHQSAATIDRVQRLTGLPGPETLCPVCIAPHHFPLIAAGIPARIFLLISPDDE
jgi:hypothetical protein